MVWWSSAALTAAKEMRTGLNTQVACQLRGNAGWFWGSEEPQSGLGAVLGWAPPSFLGITTHQGLLPRHSLPLVVHLELALSLLAEQYQGLCKPDSTCVCLYSRGRAGDTQLLQGRKHLEGRVHSSIAPTVTTRVLAVTPVYPHGW